MGKLISRRILVARRLNALKGSWEPCSYKDLRRGDVFKAFDGDTQVHPITLRKARQEDVVGFCHCDAVCFADGDWRVDLSAGVLADVMRAVAN